MKAIKYLNSQPEITKFKIRNSKLVIKSTMKHTNYHSLEVNNTIFPNAEELCRIIVSIQITLSIKNQNFKLMKASPKNQVLFSTCLNRILMESEFWFE